MSPFVTSLAGKSRHLLSVLFLLSLSACYGDHEMIAREADRALSHIVYDKLLTPDSIINPDDEYIVILGDVQEYTDNDTLITRLHESLAWALSQKQHFGNISCILQVGDVTNWNSQRQWRHYDNAIHNVVGAGLPVFSVTGNHDYDRDDNSKINDRRSTRLNEYLSYCYPDSIVKARFEDDRSENLILKLPLESVDIDLIMLEFAPRTEVVDWAAEWCRSHPEQKYLLLTHEMLWTDGTIITPGPMCYGEMQFSGTASTWTDPASLVERLLMPDPNIIASISGHNGFARYNDTSINDAGRAIPLVQFNLQYQKNGGDTIVMLLRIADSGRSAECVVYHTAGRRIIPTPLTGYRFSLEF